MGKRKVWVYIYFVSFFLYSFIWTGIYKDDAIWVANIDNGSSFFDFMIESLNWGTRISTAPIIYLFLSINRIFFCIFISFIIVLLYYGICQFLKMQCPVTYVLPYLLLIFTVLDLGSSGYIVCSITYLVPLCSIIWFVVFYREQRHFVLSCILLFISCSMEQIICLAFAGLFMIAVMKIKNKKPIKGECVYIGLLIAYLLFCYFGGTRSRIMTENAVMVGHDSFMQKCKLISFFFLTNSMIHKEYVQSFFEYRGFAIVLIMTNLYSHCIAQKTVGRNRIMRHVILTIVNLVLTIAAFSVNSRYTMIWKNTNCSVLIYMPYLLCLGGLFYYFYLKPLKNMILPYLLSCAVTLVPLIVCSYEFLTATGARPYILPQFLYFLFFLYANEKQLPPGSCFLLPTQYADRSR